MVKIEKVDGPKQEKWTVQSKVGGLSFDKRRPCKKWTLPLYSGLVHQKLDGIKDCGPLKFGEIGDEDTTSW